MLSQVSLACYYKVRNAVLHWRKYHGRKCKQTVWADVAAASSSVWAKTMRQQACGAAGHTRKDCFSYAGLRHGLGGFVVRAGTAGLRQSLCSLHPEVVLWWYKLGIPINYWIVVSCYCMALGEEAEANGQRLMHLVYSWSNLSSSSCRRGLSSHPW